MSRLTRIVREARSAGSTLVSRWLDLLVDSNFTKRFLTLALTGIGLNLAAWTIGLHLLPEGSLRGAFPGGEVVPSGGTPLEVAASILLYNVLIAGGLIIAANLFRVGRFPLGALPVLAHWSLFGVILGTNSFEFPRASIPAPSMTNLFATTGFVEICAYTMLAAATVNLFVFRQRSLFGLQAKRVRSFREISVSWCDRIALAVSILLIVIGARWESLSILMK